MGPRTSEVCEAVTGFSAIRSGRGPHAGSVSGSYARRSHQQLIELDRRADPHHFLPSALDNCSPLGKKESSLGVPLVVGLVTHTMALFLTFGGNSILFSIIAVLIYIPPAVCESLFSPISFLALAIFGLF